MAKAKKTEASPVAKTTEEMLAKYGIQALSLVAERVSDYAWPKGFKADYAALLRKKVTCMGIEMTLEDVTKIRDQAVGSCLSVPAKKAIVAACDEALSTNK